jgi:hypothetical protein
MYFASELVYKATRSFESFCFSVYKMAIFFTTALLRLCAFARDKNIPIGEFTVTIIPSYPNLERIGLTQINNLSVFI